MRNRWRRGRSREGHGRLPSRRPRSASRLALAFDRSDRLDRHGLTTGIPATGRTRMMGALELMTVIALDERRSADREMRAALTLARLGNLPHGAAHGETPR